MTGLCRSDREIFDLWVEHGIPDDSSTRDAACRLLLKLYAAHKELDAALGEVLALDQPAINAEHLAHQRDWSTQTFGPGRRTLGILDHIRKELTEIEADPLDLAEWVDVIILAFDGAWRAGWEPQQIIDAIKAKQAANEARTWPDWRTASEDHAIEHDRFADAHHAASTEEAASRCKTCDGKGLVSFSGRGSDGPDPCPDCGPPPAAEETIPDLMAALADSVTEAKAAHSRHLEARCGCGHRRQAHDDDGCQHLADTQPEHSGPPPWPLDVCDCPAFTEAQP